MMSDELTIEDTEELLDSYINTCDLFDKKSKKIQHKCCSHPPFYNVVSENIIKFALFKIYDTTDGSWDIKIGDLLIMGEKVECKAFSSVGPTSFGSTEKWDKLYFLDAIEFREKRFKLWEINLSNTDEVWRNIIISGKNVVSKEIGRAHV